MPFTVIFPAIRLGDGLYTQGTVLSDDVFASVGQRDALAASGMIVALEEGPLVVSPEPVVAPSDDSEQVKQPAPYANKSDWVAYGISQGDDRAELEALTRDKLAERYRMPPAPPSLPTA